MSVVRWFTPYDGAQPMQLAIPLELINPPKNRLFPISLVEREIFGEHIAGRVEKVDER